MGVVMSKRGGIAKELLAGIIGVAACVPMVAQAEIYTIGDATKCKFSLSAPAKVQFKEKYTNIFNSDKFSLIFSLVDASKWPEVDDQLLMRHKASISGGGLSELGAKLSGVVDEKISRASGITTGEYRGTFILNGRPHYYFEVMKVGRNRKICAIHSISPDQPASQALIASERSMTVSE
jgi:hypothetical protein